MQALINATIIDVHTDQSIPQGIIIINSEGKIAEYGPRSEVEIPRKAQKIDYEGKTIMPGLIDAHVHLGLDASENPAASLQELSDARLALQAARHAEKTLQAGVTTIRDMSARNYIDIDLREAVAAGEYPGPEIYASGRNITMTGGHSWSTGAEVDGPAQARRAARQQIKKGADQIKVMATGGVMTEGVQPGAPQLTEAELRAAIEEAHKADRKAAAHAQGTEGIKNAIRAGIDSIEHGIFLDEEALKMMRENDVYLVPTLAAAHWIYEGGEESGIPAYAVQKTGSIMQDHQQSFKMALEAGIKIGMGTDAGTPLNKHGHNHFELKLMVENGMKPAEAIAAATRVNAELLGIEDKTGTIESGKRADLLVLDKNPLQDIDNISEIHSIYKQGEPISNRQ